MLLPGCCERSNKCSYAKIRSDFTFFASVNKRLISVTRIRILSSSCSYFLRDVNQCKNVSTDLYLFTLNGSSLTISGTLLSNQCLNALRSMKTTSGWFAVTGSLLTEEFDPIILTGGGDGVEATTAGPAVLTKIIDVVFGGIGPEVYTIVVPGTECGWTWPYRGAIGIIIGAGKWKGYIGMGYITTAGSERVTGTPPSRSLEDCCTVLGLLCRAENWGTGGLESRLDRGTSGDSRIVTIDDGGIGECGNAHICERSGPHSDGLVSSCRPAMVSLKFTRLELDSREDRVPFNTLSVGDVPREFEVPALRAVAGLAAVVTSGFLCVVGEFRVEISSMKNSCHIGTCTVTNSNFVSSVLFT